MGSLWREPCLRAVCSSIPRSCHGHRESPANYVVAGRLDASGVAILCGWLARGPGEHASCTLSRQAGCTPPYAAGHLTINPLLDPCPLPGELDSCRHLMHSVGLSFQALAT